MNHTSLCLAFYFCALPRNCAIVISVLRFSWHPRQFIPPHITPRFCRYGLYCQQKDG